MARSETANRLFDRYLHEGLDPETREKFLNEYNRRFHHDPMMKKKSKWFSYPPALNTFRVLFLASRLYISAR